MSTRTLHAKLVGMKYHKYSFDLKTALKNPPSLLREPHNPHDNNAILVCINGISIGHVDRFSAAKLAPMLDKKVNYAIKVGTFTSTTIDLAITLSMSTSPIAPPQPSGVKLTGIYLICTKDKSLVYVGQSKDVNKRIQQHWSDLRTFGHDNYYLQTIWNKTGKNAFSPFMKEKSPEGIGTGDKLQIWLDTREKYWITHYRSTGVCINITEGGLTDTSYRHVPVRTNADMSIEEIKQIVDGQRKILNKSSSILVNKLATKTEQTRMWMKIFRYILDRL